MVEPPMDSGRARGNDDHARYAWCGRIGVLTRRTSRVRTRSADLNGDRLELHQQAKRDDEKRIAEGRRET